MKKWFCICMIVMISFILFGCATPEQRLICKSANGAYDNGRLYFNIGGGFMYYYDTVLHETRYLCDDALCSHDSSDCFSHIGGFGSYFLAAGDGCVYSVVQSKTGDSSAIVRFDLENQHRSYMVKGFSGNIGRFLVCTNGVFFCAHDEAGIQRIYFQPNRGKVKCMTSTLDETAVLMTYADGYVWFYDFNGTVYRADASFSDIETVCQITTGLTFGYYYLDGCVYWFDLMPDGTYQLLRCSADAPDQTEQVCQNVNISSDLIFEDSKIWVPIMDTSQSLGDGLYCIDAQTLDIQVYPMDGIGFGALAYASDTICCGFAAYMEDETLQMGYLVYDLQSDTAYPVEW